MLDMCAYIPWEWGGIFRMVRSEEALNIAVLPNQGEGFMTISNLKWNPTEKLILADCCIFWG